MKKILATVLSLCCALIFAQAQTRTIKGIITDATEGLPVIGATVALDGTAIMVTGIDGDYSINATKGQVLEFSFVGMISKKVTIGDSDIINVVLQTDEEMLSEVLVVAYGTSKKESFTGSAEIVSSEKLKDRPATNVTKMLDGQVAGVMSTSGGGQPGSGADIRIRGFGSINASNSPLIVVDGVPFDGDLNSISSSDIESLSVLKDASAGALYGARGANGVILITTTKGTKGSERMNVSFTAKAGVNSRAIPFYNTLNAQEYMEHMYTASYNDLVYVEGYLPSVAKTMAPDYLSRQILGTDNIYNIYDKDINSLFDENGKVVSDAKMRWNENWIKEAQKKAPIRQEYQLSVNGAGKNSRYMASTSFLNEEGTLKTTDFMRYTFRASADLTPKEWLEFGANINYSHSESNFLGSEGTSNNSNIWFSALLMAPIYPVYQKNIDGTDVLDRNGNRVFDYGASRPAGAQNNRNSVATLFDDDYYTLNGSVSSRAYVTFKWSDFRLTSNVGIDEVNEFETTNYNPYSGNAAGSGRLTKENAHTLSYTWNQLLMYKHSFGDHLIDAMIGHEFYNYNMRYLIGERTGFPFGNYDDLAMGSTIAEANSMSDNYSINSYLCRLNYEYGARYYFSSSFRTDASSRFKKENRWGTFWSVGASWRVSQEPFMKNISWIDNMTLKASYGVQGNDNLGSFYAWQSLYNMNYPSGTNSGAVISSIENQDVTWEKNGNFNIGLEFKLKNRLSGTIEWYNRTTSDLLLEYPMPISLGFPGYYANVGSIVNSGLDITLNYDIISNQDLDWNVTLMGSTLKNRVKKLTGNGEDIVNGVYIIREGEEINSFYMAKSAGVDPTTGEQLYWAYTKNSDGSIGEEYITNDATVAASSKYLQGSRIPTLYGSIASALTFKGFDLNLLFAYSFGGKIYDSIYSSMMEPSFVGQTYHRNALRSWRSAGQITDVPRTTTSATTQVTDRFLIDASYFAIKNIALGYNFPKKMIDKMGVENLRIYLAADSPWLFTHLQGMNPQANFSGSTSYSYTPNRTFTIGLNLKF